MFGELALPFDAGKHPIEGIHKLGSVDPATVVAIEHDGHFISINIVDLRAGDVLMFRRPDGWTGRLQSNFDVIVRYQAALLPVD
jgi:hypothetical protein